MRTIHRNYALFTLIMRCFQTWKEKRGVGVGGDRVKTEKEREKKTYSRLV